MLDSGWPFEHVNGSYDFCEVGLELVFRDSYGWKSEKWEDRKYEGDRKMWG